MEKSLAQRIHDARIQKNLTQRELAREVGVKISSIHAWEHGRRKPKRSNLYALERALGIVLRDWDEHEKWVAKGQAIFQIFDILDLLRGCIPKGSPVETHLKEAVSLLEADIFNSSEVNDRAKITEPS